LPAARQDSFDGTEVIQLFSDFHRVLKSSGRLPITTL
jgi:hypothetical protein